MMDKNVLMPEFNGRDEQDSSTKLTDGQIEGLRKLYSHDLRMARSIQI